MSPLHMTALTFPLLLLACEAPCGDPVRIEAESGEVLVDVCVTRAVTADERRRGLVGSAPLGVDEGLLIVFPVEGEVCIENGGLGYDLDVVWVGGDGRVVAVERVTDDGSEVALCHAPADRVLEVRARVADGVQAGMVVDTGR